MVPTPRRSLWTWLRAGWSAVRTIKTVLDFLPPSVRLTIVSAGPAVVVAVWAVVLSLIEQQPAHVVLLAAVWTFAAVAFGVGVGLWLYWRLQLLQLLRAVEDFITRGTAIHRTIHTEPNLANLPGHLRELEDWRTAMHRRVLRDPRAQPFRDALTDKDPARDRIWVPLQALHQLRAQLLTQL